MSYQKKQKNRFAALLFVLILYGLFVGNFTMANAQNEEGGKKIHRLVANNIYFSPDFTTTNSPKFNITMAGELYNLKGVNINRSFYNFSSNKFVYELNRTIAFQAYVQQGDMNGWLALYESKNQKQAINPEILRNWSYSLTSDNIGKFNHTFEPFNEENGDITIEFDYSISDPDVKNGPAIALLALPATLIIGIGIFKKSSNKKLKQNNGN